MSGLICLVGSGEYLPVMAEVDRSLLARCGANGRAPRVVCLPTAAGQEGEASWQRWNRMGEEHFLALGAEVSPLPIIDRRAADDERYLEALENADLIYFSGGKPTYLYETMQGSKAWAAIEKARARGAIYAGCSAGAMILGRSMPNIRMPGLRRLNAFGIVPVSMILPHFDRMPTWAPMMIQLLRSRLKPGELVIGIDEDTALVGRPGESWQVQGHQRVHIISKAETLVYAAGDEVILPN